MIKPVNIDACEGHGHRPHGDVVDIHAHFIPTAYRDALARAGMMTLDGGMPIPAWTKNDALALMDRHGIATSVLSVSSPGVNFVAQDEEASLARMINLAAAEIVAGGAGRFGAFATLPVGDPAAALAEIDHVFEFPLGLLVDEFSLIVPLYA